MVVYSRNNMILMTWGMRKRLQSDHGFRPVKKFKRVCMKTIKYAPSVSFWT